MKKKQRLIHMTSKGMTLFAAFWILVSLIVFGPSGEFEIGIGRGEKSVEGSLTIHFIDVGQADAAVLLCGGEVMMIDGGNAADSSLVYSYLKNTLGISHIDYMIATHPHEDHIGGLSGALNACTVGKVYSPVTEYESKAFESLKKYTEERNRALTLPKQGERIPLGEAEAQILSVGKQYADINDQSIVVRIVFGNTDFLFMGDAEWEAEHDLIESGYDLSATLLKVGHHGSGSSSAYAFLREVMPEYAVISVGKDNSYGHPTEAALSRLRDVGAQVFRTDLNGHIIVTSDGKKLNFSVQKGSVSADSVSAQEGIESFEEALEAFGWDLLGCSKNLWAKFISWIERSIAW